MIIIIADVDEVAALLDMDEARQPEIVRPQTSGPCVHYDERSEHAADTYPCTYPYGDEHSDGVCPHLDNPDIICPVKDACYAMHEVARMRDECEAEQDEQDADMAAVAPSQTYETAAPGRMARGGDRVSDPLNDILVECCKLRGCYPLMHRTLHEFNWFCSCVIWGAGPFIDGEIATAEADGDEALAGVLKERRNEENGIRDRFREWYSHGSDELIRFAEAYREWCREQYGDEEMGS